MLPRGIYKLPASDSDSHDGTSGTDTSGWSFSYNRPAVHYPNRQQRREEARRKKVKGRLRGRRRF